VNELDQARVLFVELLDICDLDPAGPVDADRLVTLLTNVEAFLLLTDDLEPPPASPAAVSIR
jgi:hypothetical protein